MCIVYCLIEAMIMMRIHWYDKNDKTSKMTYCIAMRMNQTKRTFQWNKGGNVLYAVWIRTANSFAEIISDEFYSPERRLIANRRLVNHIPWTMEDIFLGYYLSLYVVCIWPTVSWPLSTIVMLFFPCFFLLKPFRLQWWEYYLPSSHSPLRKKAVCSNMVLDVVASGDCS